MIIDLRTVYQFYKSEIDNKVENIKDNLSYQISNRRILEKEILNNRKAIDKYLGITHEEALKLVDTREAKNIKYPIVSIYFEGKKVNFTAIKLYIDNYAHVNKAVEQLKERLKNIQETALSCKKFSFIIKEGNNLIIDKIIKEAYEFTPMSTFGSIVVTKNSSKKERINWGASNKKKQEILDRGGIPYCKEDALNNNDYKGEQWLINHDSLDFFLHWERTYSARTYNPYLNDYAYKPARGNYGILNKFNSFKKDKELAEKIYTKLGCNERVSLSI